MNVDRFMNQDITIKNNFSTNKYNESTYNTSTIKGRFEYDRKLIKNSLGEEKISEAVLYTKSAINPDDVIHFDNIDWEIMKVDNKIGLQGNIQFYEVRL